MSVINRMLQELESRHEQPQDKLPGMVRAVPPPRRDYRRVLMLGALLMAALLGAGGYWLWEQRAVAPVQTTVPVVHAISDPPHLIEPIAAPAVPEPLPPPTEKLVTELALAPPPAPSPVHQAAPLPRSAPGLPEAGQSAKPAPSKSNEPVVKAEPAKPSMPAVTAKPTSEADIKQVTPAQRADQIYRQGLSLHTQGRAHEAQAAFEEALKLDPRHLGARQALLAALVDGKRYDQAERVVQDGLALNLATPALAMALARLQLEQGNQNAALATLDKYATQSQDNADYQSFQAALLQRAERHAEAVAHYQAALRLQPGRAVWWMGLGISLQAEKKIAEAEQAYNRARATPGLSPELQAFVEQRLKQLH